MSSQMKTIAEIKSIVQWRDEDDHLEEKEVKPRVPDNPYSNYALVSRMICDKNRSPSKRLEINSPELRNVFNEVAKDHPWYIAGSHNPDQAIHIEEPYMILYHHLDDLEKYEKDADATTREHIKLLIDFLNEGSGHEYKSLFGSKRITFPLAWAIYKPGRLIFDRNEDRLYLLKDIKHSEVTKCWELSCVYSNYNGKITGQSRKEVSIYRDQFPSNGQLHITSLSVYPLEYHEDRGGVEDRMRERAAKFLEFCDPQSGVKVRHHNGLLSDARKVGMRMDINTLTHTGRAIIDLKTCCEDHYDAVVETVVPWENSVSESDLLWPPFVYGYSLEHKCWGKMTLTDLSPVKWDSAAFDSLNYDVTRKELIRALIEFHTWPKSPREVSALKGKGLLMLFHGPPGTGKTMTAEVVAESLKKPVLTVSPGELGQDQISIEANLKTFISYATIWKAVVLIDEADVFLEARHSGSGNSLWANGLVAVFLRQLEYFQGVILLTTNRSPDAFDPAVTSRTHLILEYRFPDRETRRKLWNQSLGKVGPDRSEFSVKDALDRVDRFKMNAREISNTVNIADVLSRSENSKFKVHHLNRVLEAMESLEEPERRFTMSIATWRQIVMGLLPLAIVFATFVAYHSFYK